MSIEAWHLICSTGVPTAILRPYSYSANSVVAASPLGLLFHCQQLKILKVSTDQF